jgi:adenylate cyclase
MGEQNVKNIARPVRVYALRPEAVADLPARSVPLAAPRSRPTVLVAMAAAAAAALVIAVVAWWLWPATRSSPTATVAGAPAATSIAQPLVAPRLSIVVLPFANLSNDPEQQYFADGITEDLTTDLSRLADMFVISRNTAFTYRNKPVDAKQIGRDLGARYVLEGSVQRSGSRVRVTAQLIDAATDTHLWAERFDRDIGDLFALQNEITSRISVALSVELVGAEAARPTDNPDALDYILRGRAVNKPPSRDTYAEIIGLFERALALDPRSVEAQSRLAMALLGRALDSMSDSVAADMERAEGLIGQALAASPRFYLSHYAKAQLLRAQSRCVEAIPEYETVIALYRNWPAAYSHLGWCKFLTGSIEEAIPAQEHAIRLSPRDDNGIQYLRIGMAHLLQSRTDEAILWLEKARSAIPAHPGPHALLASAYALKGESERAAAELAEARRLTRDDRYSSIARLQAAGYWGVPKIRALYEATYFAGLRKAGVPEE